MKLPALCETQINNPVVMPVKQKAFGRGSRFTIRYWVLFWIVTEMVGVLPAVRL